MHCIGRASALLFLSIGISLVHIQLSAYLRPVCEPIHAQLRICVSDYELSHSYASRQTCLLDLAIWIQELSLS
ncbi:hypothetical protein J3E69DRAFT_349654 [Trichoderma sp. SZMC 28015]